MSNITKLNDCELGDIAGGGTTLLGRTTMRVGFIPIYSAMGTSVGAIIGGIVNGKKGAKTGSWMDAIAGAGIGLASFICSNLTELHYAMSK